MEPRIELTPEQTESIVISELEYHLLNPRGIPKKTIKALRGAYKWFCPPLRQETFLRNIENDIE